MVQSSSSSKMFGMDFMNGVMPFDFSSIIEAHRKSFETISEIQQMAVENLQAIGQHQASMISQMVEDNTTIAQQLMSEGTPEEKMARQTELVKKSVAHSIESWSELTDLVSASGKSAAELMGKRVTSSLTDIKSSVEKKSSKAA